MSKKINKQVFRDQNGNYDDENDEALDILANINVPGYLDTLKLPDPYLLQHYRNEKDRIFFVTGEIDESLLILVRFIMRYNIQDKDKKIEDRTPIKVYIDTIGGSLIYLWTVINAIKISKTPVWTVNIGNAFSAGALLLLSGQKRFALPGTNFLLHNGSCLFGGQVDQAESFKKYSDEIRKKILDNMYQRTGIDTKTYKKKAISDWYFDENEALQIGIIDKIVEDFTEIC